MVRSVRGTTGQWFRGRAIPGYYAAYLEFEDGTPATLMHNGYGYFLASELVPWGTNRGRYTYEERATIRRGLLDKTRDENKAKDALRIGGEQEEQQFRGERAGRPWVPNDLGILIVTCERGDIRQSQFGLYVYSDEGLSDVPLPPAGPSRRAELEELYRAVVLNEPIRHTGSWGMATLEVCLALMQSARERREIILSHQVPAPQEDD
jgi:phthalate 4,5-cis-dihydrodiol dehydrogenase